MTNAEDDDRSVDWAPRKIRDLERRTDDNSERLLRIEGWMARVTGEEIRAAFERELMPDEEPEEFSAPIGQLPPGEYRVRNDHPQFGLRKTDGPNADKDAILRKRRAVAPLGGLFSVGTPTRGVVPSVPHDFGPSRHPLDRIKPQEMTQIITPPDALDEEIGHRRSAWNFGHAAALDEAESRIVAALDKIDLHGRHRDEILSALRSVKNTRVEHDGPDTYPVHQDPDKIWKKGFKRGEKVGVEDAEHRAVAKLVEMGWASGSPAMLGVINAIRGTKPIKDQPQG